MAINNAISGVKRPILRELGLFEYVTLLIKLYIDSLLSSFSKCFLYRKRSGRYRSLPENDLLRALKKSWSSQSSSKWSLDNPAKGRCGVTALVVNDFLGGEIYKTWLDEGWHFYNIIDETRRDFTESQFPYILDYQDLCSSREEAFQDTNDAQYSYLKSQVNRNLVNAEI